MNTKSSERGKSSLHRYRLDILDRQIMELLAQRQRVRRHERLMHRAQGEILLNNRNDDDMEARRLWAEELGIDPTIVSILFALVESD